MNRGTSGPGTGIEASLPWSGPGAWRAVSERGQPGHIAVTGLLIWQRPTLAGPVVRLPLALRRFTSVFGMGTGGSTALWSPEAGRAMLHH